MEFNDYLFSSHGVDLGFSYVLPKNVRVILPCMRTSVSANDETDSKLWSSFIDKPDLDLTYLDNILINNLDPNRKYCVFSGNLTANKMNIIPNLFLSPEENNFKTGFIKAPLNLKRAFLKDYYSKTDNKQYLSGEIVDLDMMELKRKLDNPDSNFADKGFMRYFINPGRLNNMEFKDLNFIILNDPNNYKSFDYFQRSIYPDQKFNNLNYEIPIDKNDKFRKPDDQKFDKEINQKYVTYDTIYFKDIKEIPLDKKGFVIQEIDNLKNIIKRKNNGYFISDVIRHVCNQDENKDKFITITFSVCRKCALFLGRSNNSYYVSAIKKGTWTSAVDFVRYRQDYLQDDINSYLDSLDNYNRRNNLNYDQTSYQNSLNLLGGKSNDQKYKVDYNN